MTAFRKASELSEDMGIKALVSLEKLTGVVGSIEEARCGWAAMNDAERIQMMYFYDLLCNENA